MADLLALDGHRLDEVGAVAIASVVPPAPRAATASSMRGATCL